MMRAVRTATFLAALVALEPAAAPRDVATPAFGPSAKVVVTDESVASLFDAGEGEWAPKVAPKSRGGAEIFAKVAPATVVIRTATGYGTGFLISADGFVVTNHHVIADSLYFDPAKRASFAQVLTGRMAADGSIRLAAEPVPAYFYAADRRRDLALLKLAPAAPAQPLPFVALSDKPPRPADGCNMVGHPRAGMLWTFRSCQVAAIGHFPADMTDVVVERLSGEEPARHEIEQGLAAVAGHRILISSCEANPGDSGGPVVDESGKLIGVTFAVPQRAELSKLTYHIHVDELRAFLATRPAAPTVLAPDPWALGPKLELVDLTGEGRAQLLEAGTGQPEELLFDLDGDTDPALLRARDLVALGRDHKFEAEFELRIARQRTTAFYDTDNDGTFDLIVSGRGEPRGAADLVLERSKSGRWEARPARTGELILAPERFADPKLVRRLDLLADKLGFNKT